MLDTDGNLLVASCSLECVDLQPVFRSRCPLVNLVLTLGIRTNVYICTSIAGPCQLRDHVTSSRYNQRLFIFLFTDREVKPEKFGIVGRKGPENKQPFMVGYFRSTQELHVRKTRAAVRRKIKENVYANEEEQYSYKALHSMSTLPTFIFLSIHLVCGRKYDTFRISF